ncbi:hypothetical protein K488DRAFT_82243 [Vararia minispora EC-137]|uniref:Uncharacterized protein n=1 Tax=Vararia minispora EC-137 TaxID=1314806 RepID=A0ACB8QY62_9AGAM|nr:hypothetical protein K488DRAFT_82243 [Vararia minispora EC-137]
MHVSTRFDARPLLNFYDTVISNNAHLLNPQYRIELREEIHTLDTASLLLRQRLNAMAPVATLAPEILSIIFGELVHLDPPTHPKGDETPESVDPDEDVPVKAHLGWVGVTHVCRQWRDVAISDTRLWSLVSNSLGCKMALEMVRRRGGAPFRLDLNTRTRKDGAKVRAFLMQLRARGSIQAITELRYAGSASFPFTVVTSASNLRSLRICNTDIFCDEEDTSAENLQFSHLQELDLKGADLNHARFNTSIVFLQTIKFLSLSPCRETAVHFSILVDTLQRLPHLEGLDISGYYIIVFEDVDEELPIHEGVPPIYIPNLKTLALCLPITPLLALFHRLRIHPDAQLRLICELPDITMEEFFDPGILPMVFTGRLAPYLTAVRTLEIRETEAPCYPSEFSISQAQCGIVLSGWRTYAPDYLLADYDIKSPPPPLPEVRIAFIFTHDSVFSRDNDVTFNDLLPIVPLAHIQALSIVSSSPSGWEFSSDLFELNRCASLAWLRVDRLAAKAFLNCHNTGGMADRMPLLRTLALLGLKWPRGPNSRPPSAEEQLLNLWHARKAMGKPLERVIIGRIPRDGCVFGDALYNSDIQLESVERPAWIQDDHPDYDCLIEW